MNNDFQVLKSYRPDDSELTSNSDVLLETLFSHTIPTAKRKSLRKSLLLVSLGFFVVLFRLGSIHFSPKPHQLTIETSTTSSSTTVQGSMVASSGHTTIENWIILLTDWEILKSQETCIGKSTFKNWLMAKDEEFHSVLTESVNWDAVQPHGCIHLEPSKIHPWRILPVK